MPAEPEPQIVLDIFISKEWETWVLLVAYDSWWPAALAGRLNDKHEISLVPRPDLDELEQYMRRLDAPYLCKVAKFDGVQLRAEGRAAVVLGTWLEGYLKQPVVDSTAPLSSATEEAARDAQEDRSKARDSDRSGSN